LLTQLTIGAAFSDRSQGNAAPHFITSSSALISLPASGGGAIAWDPSLWGALQITWFAEAPIRLTYNVYDAVTGALEFPAAQEVPFAVETSAGASATGFPRSGQTTLFVPGSGSLKIGVINLDTVNTRGAQMVADTASRITDQRMEQR
jgi:hypothetical protein